MTNEKNMTADSSYAPWDLRRLPNFDFSEFLRTVDKSEGKRQTAELTLEGTKRWFRLACPNGGLVLNALRVTDAMAIFESRVFADANDRNPLASFTATKKADKATGDAYIRAAQDAALEGALRTSGFCLEVSLLARTVGASETAARTNETDRGEQPAEMPVEAPKPSPAPVQADVPRQKAGDGGQPPVDQANPQPKPEAGSAPRPAPVDPQHHEAVASQLSAPAEARPAPVAPQPHAAPAPENKDAAPVVDINTRQPVAADTNAVVTPPAPAPAPVAEPAPEVPAEPTPVTYTADMTVEEITARMTLEQAKAIKVPGGTCKGWTLEQVAKDRPPSLKWLRYTAPFADNVLKAAADIVLSDLELKAAG